MTESNEGHATGDPEGGPWVTGRGPRRPAPVYFDLDAYRNLTHGKTAHPLWLDPCSSAEDAAAIWSAFGFDATAERVDRLLHMRHPKYLHHDIATHQVRIVNVEEVRPALLPMGHLVTGSGTPGQAEPYGD